MLSIDRNYIKDNEETVIKFLEDRHPGLEVTELRSKENICCWIRVPESFFDDPTAAFLACWKKYQGLDEGWEADNLDRQEAEAVYENMLLPEISGYEQERIKSASFVKTINQFVTELINEANSNEDDGWFRNGKPLSDEDYIKTLLEDQPAEITLLSKDEDHQYYFGISHQNYIAFFCEV